MQALYRQYRPKKFADVVGQEHIVKTLQNQIKRGTVAHAYVFVGTRGVGKTSVARLFAAAANCLKAAETGEVCGTCVVCEQIEHGQFPDIIEIDAASHTGVDNVRSAIVEAVRFAPMQGARKVFIIDEVHMLSTSSFNALLKTLEEPPAHALFILATTEFRKVPETVASRCQRFFFQNISETHIESTLRMIAEKEGRPITDEAVHAVARIANGSLRDGERTLEQVFGTTDGKIDIEHVQQVVPVPSADIVFSLLIDTFTQNAEGIEQTLKEAAGRGVSMRLLLEELIELCRTQLLSLQGAKTLHTLWTNHARWIELRALVNAGGVLRLLRALTDYSARGIDIGVPYLGIQLALLSQSIDVMPAAPSAPVAPPKAPAAPEATRPAQPAPTPATPEPPVSESARPVVAVTPAESLANQDHLYTLEELQNKWGRCCEMVSRQSVSLPLVLRDAKPSAYDGTVLEVTFDRLFHFETMSDLRNLKLLTGCVREVIQKEIAIKPIFVPKPAEKQLEDVASAFGGTILEA